MKIQLRLVPMIFIAIALFFSTLYVLSPKLRILPIQTLGLVVTVGTAVIGVYAARIYGFKSANGRAIILIAAGIVCWSVGELIWYVMEQLVMAEDFFPSIADVLFLLGYPFFIAGIYQGFRTSEIKLKQVKRSLLVVVLSVSFVLTVLVAYFGVYQAYDPEANLAANIVNISYGLSDLVLIILSLLTILVAGEYQGGRLASFWKTMAAAFFLTLIADILFAFYSDQFFEDIKPYTFIDLIWMSGYLLLAYGMLQNYLHVSAIQKNIRLKLMQRSNPTEASI